ncbi:MAG TPA: bifunctional methylenetetrahydrofolate dehydrogenase/methenyltetrahydrofolate cyclohydrolase FolD [Bryobacteraceae bacterium]|nr:bifunctional methylenetetrahydrofolate dehydrogenase/methenyltetrahydrofolate cyclohydrolase FolD [Bryobacteraceae bacterium]
MPQILDGNHVRDQIKAECRPRVERVVAHAGRAPGLAVVLVGNNPASEVYVRNKTKTATDLGIHAETITPSASMTTEQLLDLVKELNSRPEIDGILVQLPLPNHIDSQRVLLAVSPEKDVDGFHPCNVGLLSTGRPGLRPCTPAGVIQILKRYELPIAGRNAVVVGRSDIVGKPMAMLLLQENATVTVCHSRTRDLPAVCRSADILVAAIGRAAMVTADYMKPGAVVIDVGMNKVETRAEAERIFDAAKLADFDRRGSLLVGDVHPGDMARQSSAYTPVPGGVGPLTIAMLMRNTIESAERRTGLA